jgi:hypothetical protein
MSKTSSSILGVILLAGTALAQPAPPAPPTPPTEPTAAPPDPGLPAAPPAAAPAEVPADAAPAPVVTTTAAPPAITDAKPSPGEVVTVDSGEPPAVTTRAKTPRIALELSGTGSYTANQYIEYRGYKLEHGSNKGVRVEANVIGIQAAYEMSSLSNTQVCGVGCMTGDYGSTTMHSLELGYRFRLGMMGPVRPFIAASLGGVLANAGTWSPMTDKNVLGGSGRAAFGIEYPITSGFFVSATLAYRILVTENPLRDEDEEKANKILTGNTDIPSGDYAEDLHLISAYVGIGLTL